MVNGGSRVTTPYSASPHLLQDHACRLTNAEQCAGAADVKRVERRPHAAVDEADGSPKAAQEPHQHVRHLRKGGGRVSRACAHYRITPRVPARTSRIPESPRRLRFTCTTAQQQTKTTDMWTKRSGGRRKSSATSPAAARPIVSSQSTQER